MRLRVRRVCAAGYCDGVQQGRAHPLRAAQAVLLHGARCEGDAAADAAAAVLAAWDGDAVAAATGDGKGFLGDAERRERGG